MAPLQQRLLGDGKIQSICGCRTMARTCVTSFCVRWRARGAEPSLSRTHRGWVWRMASDLGASGVLQACTTPIVRRREKSSISEIRRSFFCVLPKTSARRARDERDRRELTSLPAIVAHPKHTSLTRRVQPSPSRRASLPDSLPSCVLISEDLCIGGPSQLHPVRTFP